MNLLDAAEVRVLGSLIEKEATTPEYYPLTLNALVNACNQKSNRDPVVDFDESTVREALEGLRAKRFAFVIEGSRATKYSQRFSETLNIGRRELAALCVLMLRGPQTLGEIKDRSERMFAFADLSETETVLEKLISWPDGALVTRLPRQPGQKELRYAHLLSGEVDTEAVRTAAEPAGGERSRLAQLEDQVSELRSEVNKLHERMDEIMRLLQ